MFDKISEAAEKLATNVSRREFMGGLGKGALALAGAMGAMLAFPRLVQAAGGQNACYCSCGYGGGYAKLLCVYLCPDGLTHWGQPTKDCTCKPQDAGCVFLDIECGCI
jgi:hypothetical protein